MSYHASLRALRLSVRQFSLVNKKLQHPRCKPSWKVFAACANYFEHEITEATERSRLKSTRSYLRSLCFLLFNAFWCGRRPCWVSFVLLTAKIFASCENFLTEGNEGNKGKETQRLAFLGCLCFLLFNKLVAVQDRAGFNPWLIFLAATEFRELLQ